MGRSCRVFRQGAMLTCRKCSNKQLGNVSRFSRRKPLTARKPAMSRIDPAADLNLDNLDTDIPGRAGALNPVSPPPQPPTPVPAASPSP
ncbi:hypothetical protein NOGI109294_04065 [Nocardiopsis gilva]